MCYHVKEVSAMDEEILQNDPQEQEHYTPRPKWQIIGAWIALGLFVLLLLMYYANIFRGGA